MNFCLRIFCLVCLAIFAASPNRLYAGAWGVKPKSSQVIMDYFAIQNSETDDRGAVEYYSEYGIFNGISTVSEANLQIEREQIVSSIAAQTIKFTRQYRNVWAFSVAIGASSTQAYADDIISIGPIAKAMIGRSFADNNWVNLEFGGRKNYDEISQFGEFSIGHRFANEDLIIGKYLADGGFLSNFGNILQISYAKSINKNWKLEFGYRQAIGNNSRTQNAGVLIGLWWQK